MFSNFADPNDKIDQNTKMYAIVEIAGQQFKVEKVEVITAVLTEVKDGNPYLIVDPEFRHG